MQPPGALLPRQPLGAAPLAIVKRCVDIALALLARLVLAAPLLGIAFAIRRETPGPVLFRQLRTGLHGRGFMLLKFRTMHHHLADPSAASQTRRGDPRVTRVGAFLRRTSLDELPQLLNVLRGDMSLVGPRPHAPGTCAGSLRFDDLTRRYAARHWVRPGLTGLAQVRGQRGAAEDPGALMQRVESDLEYVATWSLGLDALILLRTAPAVLRMRNAF